MLSDVSRFLPKSRYLSDHIPISLLLVKDGIPEERKYGIIDKTTLYSGVMYYVRGNVLSDNRKKTLAVGQGRWDRERLIE